MLELELHAFLALAMYCRHMLHTPAKGALECLNIYSNIDVSASNIQGHLVTEQCLAMLEKIHYKLQC